MEGYTMHVVSHTHWDREWYLTFQQFRIRLVDLMDNLLDILDTDPHFEYFNLDGQTIILEDYLEIRPENEDRLRKYIAEGRILIGPWYQLNDEFLVSGESTIRSLLIGHRMAQDFGGVMKVGYLPDQFGNISQMPQIFREFGIDNVIFGRGYQLVDDRKMEFLWESPDGSQVLASLMAFWYNNAQRFPYKTAEAVEYAKRIKETMSPHTVMRDLLLMNGVDHLEAQRGLPEILKRVNEKLEQDRLVHSTLPSYVQAVKDYVKDHNIDLRRIRGELREDRYESVLAGTLSSRMYIKQANKESETWMEKYAEPSASFAWMLDKGYPSGILNYAWKLLLQNHPHDSICGCSIDQVHDEMMPRFDQVQQIGEEITARSLDQIASRVKTEEDSLVVFNPLNWPRSDRMVVEIDFPIGDVVRGNPTVDPSRDVAAIRLLDPAGADVPYKLLDTRIMGKQVLSPIELPMSVMVRRFKIEFVAEDVPSCGYKTYTLSKVDAVPTFEDSPIVVRHDENTISNGHITISPHSGGIRICDEGYAGSKGERCYTGLGIFEDRGDVGDEYRYVKPANDRIVTTRDGNPEVTLIDNSPVSATLKLRTVMRLPASADANEQGRSDATVECPVTSSFTVFAGSSRVDVATEVENAAKDHRLRVLFPSGIAADTAHAEGHFDVLTRPIRPPAEWTNASTFFPQRSWVNVTDGNRGLTIINKGLPEYEVYEDSERTIALTLLRCVSRLSGGGETADALPTPGAQCLGTHRFEYAILPHRGGWTDAQVWKQAHQHNAPPACIQTDAHDGDQPLEQSFVEVTPAGLIVIAIKKAEDRDSLMVRFFNILEKGIHQAHIRVPRAVSARTVNLNEEPGNELIIAEDGTVTVDVPAKKIATLEFQLGG